MATKIRQEQMESFRDQLLAAGATLPTTADKIAVLDDSDGDALKSALVDDLPFATAIHAHTHSDMTNRTRIIPFSSFHDTATAIGQADVHGLLSQDIHFHLPDAVTTTIKNASGIAVPSDVVSGQPATLNFLVSSTVGGGNFNLTIVCREVGNGATFMSSLYLSTANFGAPSAANTMLLYAFSLSSAPSPGSIISFAVVRNGANAGDTNTGIMCFWGAWIDYTADM